MSTARQWIASLGEEVYPVELDGAQAGMLAAHAPGELPPARPVHPLPGFDQYVVAASAHAEPCCPAIFEAAFIGRRAGFHRSCRHGRMQGTWRHLIKGSRVEVIIEPFVKAPLWVRRAAGHEAERLAAFLGCTLSVCWKN